MNRKYRDWSAAVACTATGVLMATLPHLIAWARTGRPEYVVGPDEMHYLAISSQAYFDHPGRLADPVRREYRPSPYMPLAVLPGIWAAKLLDLGPLGISLAWRVLGGVTAGLGWYVLFSPKNPGFRRSGVANGDSAD